MFIYLVTFKFIATFVENKRKFMKPEEILARINEARTRKNIGYTYIIKNTGFGKTYVSKALNGKLSIGLKNLCMLCDCLGLELVVKDVETNETQS